MSKSWQQGVRRITLWLLLEIIFNLFGLDNIADYSEFIFEQKLITANSSLQVVQLI